MTRKNFLWLMAIAIITVFVALACSDKPTDANASNFSEIEYIEQAPRQMFNLDTVDNLEIDSSRDLTQFEGKSFKSGAYIRNKDYSKLFYYYADVNIDSQSKPYISVIRKYAEGNVLEDIGKLYPFSDETGGTYYNLEVVRYKINSSSKITARATFTEDGQLIIKFSNYGAEIILSLTKDSLEGIYRSSELAGDWNDKSEVEESEFYWKQLKVDYYGNVELLSGDIPGEDISYTGKIDEIFQQYPYTITISCVDNDGNSHSGTVTFNNETSAEASFDAYVDLSWRPTWWGWEKVSRSFTKE